VRIDRVNAALPRHVLAVNGPGLLRQEEPISLARDENPCRPCAHRKILFKIL